MHSGVGLIIQTTTSKPFFPNKLWFDNGLMKRMQLDGCIELLQVEFRNEESSRGCTETMAYIYM
jgi:hypothetical protein